MTDTLCEHLQPALKLMLAQGNVIDYVSKGWSDAKLVVTLRNRVEMQKLQLHLDPCVETWQFADPHYPREAGLYCTIHKHSVGWPLPK